MRWNGLVIWRAEKVMIHSKNTEQSSTGRNPSGHLGGGFSMKFRLMKIFAAILLLAVGLIWNSCGSQPGCPTCGTTTNGAYGVIDVVPVPEHNPTGEPGGPFNSFDISWFDPNQRVVYTSDRIGLDVVVTSTTLDEAVNTIGGLNEVAQAGNNGSPCIGSNTPAPGTTAATTPNIPSIITGLGSQSGRGTAAVPQNILTRFGCRNPGYFDTFSTFFPGFGANGFFGGFPGAQCCAARANGVNPLSGPNGLLVTPDGTTLFAGSGSSTVVVVDVSGATSPPMVIADFPTGSSPDFDGPVGVAPCIASWNGGAGSDPTCGDDRSDEMAFGTIPAGCTPSATSTACHAIFAVINGDPGLPMVSIVDVTDIVTRNYTNPMLAAGQGICAPVNPAANYTPGVVSFATGLVTGSNYPTCILGQIYYDGASPQSSMVPVDNNNGFFCPDPSEAVPSGVSGQGVGVGGANVPCHHGPIVDSNTGVFITNNGTATSTQTGEIAPAGLGGLAFNPFHNTFYLANSNCTVSNLPTQASVAVGCIDEIDPQLGNPNGPIVIASIPVLNCMAAAIVQGPGHDFLIGCGDHDGIAFPPNCIIFDGTTNQIVATITQTGGTDEVWYNPGDNRYYTAGRDMPNGPVMGVIDAGQRIWLVNVPTNSNSHSVAADSINNHIFVPSQAGNICSTQSSNGCILVYARQ